MPDSFLSLQIGFLHLSLWLQVQVSHSCPPPSPQLQQPDHMSLPHRGCFAFFHSARGQNDGFIWGQVSLRDPLFHGQRVGGRVSLYNYSCRGQILWATGKSERDRDQLSKTDTRKMATAECGVFSEEKWPSPKSSLVASVCQTNPSVCIRFAFAELGYKVKSLAFIEGPC